MIEQLYNALDITSLTYAQHTVMLICEAGVGILLTGVAVALSSTFRI